MLWTRIDDVNKLQHKIDGVFTSQQKIRHCKMPRNLLQIIFTELKNNYIWGNFQVQIRYQHKLKDCAFAYCAISIFFRVKLWIAFNQLRLWMNPIHEKTFHLPQFNFFVVLSSAHGCIFSVFTFAAEFGTTKYRIVARLLFITHFGAIAQIVIVWRLLLFFCIMSPVSVCFPFRKSEMNVKWNFNRGSWNFGKFSAVQCWHYQSQQFSL